jgi:ribosomal protein S12 methylthiotransferase accessory factor YcaO
VKPVRRKENGTSRAGEVKASREALPLNGVKSLVPLRSVILISKKKVENCSKLSLELTRTTANT